MYISQLTVVIALFASFHISAQRVHFDKSGKAVDPSNSYYYRELAESPDLYRSYYTNGDSKYFEGRILNASGTNEGDNVYVGRCIWYFKNGTEKLVQEYNEKGQLNGTVTHYYESGSIWKEVPYKNGALESSYYFEFDEEGVRTKIFMENFENNSNDWDVYSSSQSDAKFENGKLVLTAMDARGTSRYINIQTESSEFSLECKVNIRMVKTGGKAGLIIGFRDWDNYWYYTISRDTYYIGQVYEGILTEKVQGRYSSDISINNDNTLKIITQDDKFYFSINGSMQYSCSRTKLLGRNYGLIVGGKTSKAVFDDLIFKEFAGSDVPPAPGDVEIRSTGSGLIISPDGYFVTNHHVIEGVKETFVEISMSGKIETFKTRVIQKDKANDLAILKIDDERFKPFDSLGYSVRHAGGIDVGAAVFTIGFPLALSGLGKEPKFSDGKISAKTGYNNAVNSFQTTIPIQPGNSGGPLFNDKGELIGIINASVTNTDNVSYAIKVSNLANLVDLIAEIPSLPDSSQIKNSRLEDQIKELTKYVVLVKSK